MSLPYNFVTPELHERRERVFLIFVALFLGSMTMLNILGVSRFIDMSFEMFGVKVPFVLAVGVLPYPITFLCTDFISELYGRRRANYVVLMGLMLNVWIFLFMWIGGMLPPLPEIDPATGLPPSEAYEYAFYRIRRFTMGAIVASMLAYMAAQFCDVWLFHFWKNLTRGKHLWLRNNGSTMVSQLIDSIAVIYITHYYAGGLLQPGEPVHQTLWVFIASSYVFKFTVALLDTIPFYIGVHYLSRYLQIDPRREHDADAEETAAA